MRTDMIGLVTLILVFLAWLVFGGLFLFRKKPPKAKETKRLAAAKWGIALQGLGFALVGWFHRAHWWPFAPSRLGEVALATASVALAYTSCLFSLRAVQTLGKQWTYEARVIQGHELITPGAVRYRAKSNLPGNVRPHACHGHGLHNVVGLAGSYS